MTKSRGIRSIEVGAKILAALTTSKTPMVLKDIAAATGLSPAQVHTYLSSFRSIDLVEQLEKGGAYRLGVFALELGMVRARSIDPLQIARIEMRSLSEDTGLTVALVVWGSYGPTVIEVQEGARQVYTNTRTGTVYSVTGTASGRVFAAFLPQEFLTPVIEHERDTQRLSMRVGVSKKLPPALLTKIRNDGFDSVIESPRSSIGVIAAPIFDHILQLKFVMTLIGPADQFQSSRGRKLIRQLVGSTRKISFDLGAELVSE